MITKNLKITIDGEDYNFFYTKETWSQTETGFSVLISYPLNGKNLYFDINYNPQINSRQFYYENDETVRRIINRAVELMMKNEGLS